MKALFTPFIRLSLCVFLFFPLAGYSQFNTQVNAGPDVTICPGEPTYLNAMLGSGNHSGCVEPPAATVTCTSCNLNISGSGSVNVNSGQKVCVQANATFTGSINLNGGTLVVCGTINPQNVNFNSGHIVVIGTATFNNLNMNNSSSTLKNYGTLTLQNFTFNGTFENHGTATKSSDFNVNSNAMFVNTGTFTVAQNFNNNANSTNSGMITVNGALQNNGSGVFNNNCQLNVNGNLFANGQFNNNGSLSGGNFSFQWSPAAGLSNANIKNPQAGPSSTTTYTVTVTGPNGFSRSDQVTVFVNASKCDRPPVSKVYTLEGPTVDTTTMEKVVPPMYVYDRFGNKTLLEDIEIPSNSEIAGIFRLHFIDDDQNSGTGFDNVVLGPNNDIGDFRRAVIVQMYTDLSQLIGATIPDPYPTDGFGTPFIDIEITSGVVIAENGVPQPGALGAASSYYLEAGTGVTYGMVWNSIVNGFDPYYQLNNTPLGPGVPSPVRYMGMMRINFAHPFYLGTAGPLAIGAGEYDLYSVALHEALHQLGFASLIAPTGESVLSKSNPGIYSVWDRHLFFNNVRPLIIENVLGRGCNSVGYDLTPPPPPNNAGCTPFTIFFRHSNGTTNGIYSPAAFQVGSSLSHFNCAAPVPGFATNFTTTIGAGSVQRTPHQSEVRALCTMGYRVSGNYGNGVVNFVTSANPRVYPLACGAGAQNRVVSGINDFRPYTVDNTGQDFRATAGVPITFNFNDFLANDFPAGVGNVQMTCLELVYGGGTTAANVVINNPTSFTYTPPVWFSGVAMLKYRPIIAGGTPEQRGNMTYIFISVSLPDPPPCGTIPACDLLGCAGGFELADLDGVSNFSVVGPPLFVNTPDLVVNSIINPRGTHPLNGESFTPSCTPGGPAVDVPMAQEGTRSVYLLAGRGAQNASEGIHLPLTTPLTVNRTYEISFWAQTHGNCPAAVEIILNENPPCISCPTPPCSPGLQNWTACGTFNPNANFRQSVSVTNQGVWRRYSVFYTVPAGVSIDNFIIRHMFEYLSPGNVTVFNAVFIDNVQIIDAGEITATTAISDATPCTGSNFSITYTICLNPGLASNANLYSLQIPIPSGFTYTGGNFSGAGTATIPVGGLSSNPAPAPPRCTTLVANFTVLPSVAVQTPTEFQLLITNRPCGSPSPSLVRDNITPLTCCTNMALNWATYFGGNNRDNILGVDVDRNGDILIAGVTRSTLLPTTPGTLQNFYGGGSPGLEDAFVAKINSAGTSILWVTRFQGNNLDQICRVSVDQNGNAYTSGFTTSLDLPRLHVPTGNLLMGPQGGLDAYVSKLNGANGQLIWATYFGGPCNESGEGGGGGGAGPDGGSGVIASQYIFTSGTTCSPNLPARTNNFAGGGSDIYCNAFNRETGQLIWTSYLGGPGIEDGWGAEYDGNGHVFTSGYIIPTTATDLPIHGVAAPAPANQLYGGRDMLIGRFNSVTGAVERWAIIGGDGLDFSTDLIVTRNNQILVPGTVNSTGPSLAPFNFNNARRGGSDATVHRLDVNLNVISSTYYGGNGNEDCQNIALDEFEDMYIVGGTSSLDLNGFSSPVIPAYHSAFTGGPDDIFVAKIRNNAAYTVEWFTYYGSGPTPGTPGREASQAVEVGPNNELVIGDWLTSSTNFEVFHPSGPIQPATASAPAFVDAGVIKFDCSSPPNARFGSFISDEAAVEEVKIYPNPFSGRTNIVIAGNSQAEYKITLMNSLGIIIAEMDGVHANETTEVGEGLSNGLYFVQIVGNGQTYLKKIIKSE